MRNAVNYKETPQGEIPVIKSQAEIWPTVLDAIVVVVVVVMVVVVVAFPRLRQFGENVRPFITSLRFFHFFVLT